jgi:hypothetical protein
MILTQTGEGQTTTKDKHVPGVKRDKLELQTHPNPLSGVEFGRWCAAWEKQQVAYAIYNAEGRLVPDRLQGAPGIYFYSLQYGEHTIAGKVVIIKQR